MEHSMTSLRKMSISLVIALVVLTSSLIVLGITVPMVKELGVYKSHHAINITSNLDFTVADGVIRGSGTANDPYVIEGWNITSSTGPAISISNTDAFVVIRNSSFKGSSYFALNDGISIQSARNVFLENLTVQSFRTGIVVEGSRIAPSSNIEVKTCGVTNCANGIVGQNTTGLLVEHSLLRQLDLSGLTAENCSAVDVLDNEVSSFGEGPQSYYQGGIWQSWQLHFPEAGIGFADSSNLRVRDNAITGGGGSIENLETARCNNVSIANNSLRAGYGNTALVSGCNNVSVSNNTVTNGVQIAIVSSENCLVADNFVSNVSPSGIQVLSTSKVAVVRNTVLRSGGGIYASYMNDSRVEENVLANCSGSGLSLTGTNVTISRNLFMSDPNGIVLAGDNITFKGNQVQTNRGSLWGVPHGGLNCYGSDRLIVENNSFSSNYPGISISSCSNVSLQYNNISDNITLWAEDNMTVWGNSMHDVSVPGYFTFGVVSWDQGYPKGGNSWSQYAGVDQRSGPNQDMPGPDGIGDTPYLVNGSEYDNYPLMSAPTTPDVEPPFTVLSVSGAQGERGWFRSAVNFTLFGFDVHSGTAVTRYRIDAGAWTTFSSKVMIAADGVHSLQYYSADRAGNAENTWTATIKIDTEPPHSAISDGSLLDFTNTKTIALYYEYADNTSGLSYFTISQESSYWYGMGDSAVPFAQIVLLNGDQAYYITAYDEAGNIDSVLVRIHDSLNEDKQPLSPKGPFGPWFSVAVFADLAACLVLLGYLVHRHSLVSYAPAKPPRKKLEPGEVDKEGLVDGYPKYLKKM